MPSDWQNWPDRNKFALVLTHDVESSIGCPRINDLMKLEKRLGFKSSFNFVAKDYSIPGDIIRTLSSHNFEVGIHGLHHNAKMYFSRASFISHAKRINHFIEKWNTVGFRSPSMYHKLAWLHSLNIGYDASTFDTDPFEPQPDGAETIFPFWVSHRDNTSGFVELPYTLPQDFTLFIILKEHSIDIWKQKLDWIASNGGMALLNTHPDYMAFDNSKRRSEEYPVGYYQEFLEYVKNRYSGQYWQALPREVASFYEENHSNTSHVFRCASPAIHVCMPTYSFYESDNRVRRYAESLVSQGCTVDIFCLRNGDTPRYEIMDGVRVHRIQKREKNERSRWKYIFRLLVFLFRTTNGITFRHLKKPYDLIHAHNIPDFEVFSALIPKLTGSKIILDIHDIVPELFCSKFGTPTNSVYFRFLKFIERISISFADHVIVSNDIWLDRITSRATGRDKCSSLINYPEPSVFNDEYRSEKPSKDFIVYPGSLNRHQGLDIALKAFSSIKARLPNVDFYIYGSGPALNELKKQATDLELHDRVFFKGSIDLQKMATVMARAKCGVVPKRADLFGNEAFSTKILEFMALGVPVVVSETAIDRHYFNDSQVLFFEPGDEKDLADKLLLLLTDETLRDKLVQNSLKLVRENNWDKKKHIYFSIIDSLMREKRHENLRNKASFYSIGK